MKSVLPRRTATMCRPVRWARKPRTRVSTSGSSGIETRSQKVAQAIGARHGKPAFQGAVLQRAASVVHSRRAGEMGLLTACILETAWCIQEKVYFSVLNERQGERLTMSFLLIAAVGLLSFANGANDNFKGVATLWGAGRTTYKRALAWATAFTFLVSLVAIWAGGGLAAKFSGAKLVGKEIYTQMPFLAAVALAAAGTVLLASRLGLPISTTHVLTGALVGAGVTAAGFAHVKFAALASGVVLPLLFSPIVSLALTMAICPLIAKLATGRDCVCVDQPQSVVIAAQNTSATAVLIAPPAVRFSITDGVHWLSGAGISFARGLNDTPKITAVLLVAAGGAGRLGHTLFGGGPAPAPGGGPGAAPGARAMSKKTT